MEESNQKRDHDQARETLAQVDNAESWSEHVENLLESGDADGAISYLESFISRLDGASSTSSTGDLQLAAAMSDLADLYSSKGYTNKADDLRSRAISIRARVNQGSSTSVSSANLRVAESTSVKEKNTEELTLPTTSSNDVEDSEEVLDWEDIAETDMSLLSLKPKIEASLAESGNLGQKKEDKSSGSDKKPKRKGRGSFLYDKSMLYSDTPRFVDDESDEGYNPRDSLSNTERKNEAKYGTRHVLVLYDLPTSTRTTDLEKVFAQFEDAGVAIRWVNDTSALAVFRNPSLADSAKSCIPSRYKFRCLHKNDEILTNPKIDLDPPYPRPKTSAKVAQRMITQTMGIRIGSPGSGIREHRQQEKERKDRIATRQALRDDAWGSD